MSVVDDLEALRIFEKLIQTADAALREKDDGRDDLDDDTLLWCLRESPPAAELAERALVVARERRGRQ